MYLQHREYIPPKLRWKTTVLIVLALTFLLRLERVVRNGTAAKRISTDAVPTPADRPPRCHFVGVDPARQGLWHHNSRAFCLVSSFCLLPSTRTDRARLFFGADPSNAKCSLDRPDLRESGLRRPFQCARRQQEHVFCHQGCFRESPVKPLCPRVDRLSDMPAKNASVARHLPENTVAIVVPAFAFTRNIFHFSFVLVTLVQILTELHTLVAQWDREQSLFSRLRGARSPPPRHVEIVFRAGRRNSLWAGNLTNVLMKQLAFRSGLRSVKTSFLDEDTNAKSRFTKSVDTPVCARTGVLIGGRGNMGLWPFPNSTAISLDGDRVPISAVALRAAVYRSLEVNDYLSLSLPDGTLSSGGFPEHAVFPLPPRVIGYAMRETVADPKPGQTIKKYLRRFSDADALWFHRMLRRQASVANWTFQAMTATEDVSIENQVRWFANTGLVVGIHGANLVNSMFARPFSGLLEIFPGTLKAGCYRAGMNSGLRYWEFRGSYVTAEESFCAVDDVCQRQRQQRIVKINYTVQRNSIRKRVQEGIEHIEQLHRLYPQGIPVRLDKENSVYYIDKSRKRG